MMKTPLHILLIALVLLASCEKKKTIDNSTPCITGTSTSGWTAEALGFNYKISFPGWYTGGGYIVFEGDMFNKQSVLSGDTVYVLAAYGNSGLSTSIWGPVLVNTNTNTVDINHNGRVITLEKKKRICNKDVTLGYYYYTLKNGDTSTTRKATGAVFLREDPQYPNTDFKQNLVIDFPTSKEAEVAGIVSSIKPK